MKLSVIIPVYNAEENLRECLDSVLQQDLEDLEVICVDDASTDGSAALVEEYCEKDARVHLLRNQKNCYAGACRNRGMETAQGEFLHFLDSDDVVAPGVYRKILQKMETFDVDVVKGTGRGFCQNAQGEREWISAGPLLELSELPQESLEKPFSFAEHAELLSHVSVVPWNGIYRRQLLEKYQIRYNDLVCVNDRSFFNEVTMAARRILLTRECFVYYRVNQGGSLMGRRAKNFECEFRSYEIVKQQLQKYQVSPDNCRIVLERELADVFLWYRRYHSLPDGVGRRVTEQTRAFAEGLNLSVFAGEETKARWYRTYRFLSGTETAGEKLRRAAAGVLRRIKKS